MSEVPEPKQPDASAPASNDEAPVEQAKPTAVPSAGVVWMARLCGLVQLVFGVIALVALKEFLQETDENESRYQYLLVPILIWMVSLTVLFASVLVLVRSDGKLGLLDKIWFQFGSSIPSIAMAGVFLTPGLG